jgi:hypothetical protein
LLPWWPHSPFFASIKYILLFTPRWLFISTLFILLISLRNLLRWQKVILPFLFFISFQYLDVGIDLSYNKTFNKTFNKKISIITANIGSGGKEKNIQLLLKYYQPDILLLQDAPNFSFKDLTDNYQFFECSGELCIISKYPFKKTNQLNRSIVGGWGSFAIFYELSIDELTYINIANVHLQSVRSTLVDIAKGNLSYSKITQLENNKHIESGLLGSWINNNPFSIVAGDFNMTVNENIYYENFSSLSNALSIAGNGFKHTLSTLGLYLRIDHILFNDSFDIVDAKVIESLGGDHLPVMVTLSIKE